MCVAWIHQQVLNQLSLEKGKGKEEKEFKIIINVMTIEKVLTREETLGRFLYKRRDSTWLYTCTVPA